MTNQFVAIDVETANPDLASICQIGAVTIAGGKITDRWQTLVNPEDYFDGFNVSIHGIQETDVAQAPTFPQVVSHLKDLLRGEIVASHTPFDKVAFNRVCDKYNLPQMECSWLHLRDGLDVGDVATGVADGLDEDRGGLVVDQLLHLGRIVVFG